MSEVRFAVVGFGNIGQTHCATIMGDDVPRGRVTAVVASKAPQLPEGVMHFSSLQDLLAADAADAIVIATPTHSHPALGHQVLDAGMHLVMEKPVAMSLQAAQALLAAVPDNVHAAVMLNQRFHPVYRKIQEILSDGQIGTVVRFNWIMTAWYRPDVYFNVSRWRGTWQGEGGGALLNQCIHNLDILCWLFGQPESVVADARFGKFHAIEVEDEVSAILSYVDGVTGTVVASTGEAPGINRLDIVGDRGTISFDGEHLTLTTTEQSVSEHCATTRQMFGMPEFHSRAVDPGPAVNQHAAVFNNLADAVVTGAPLQTPLAEGLASVALANTMLLSAWEDRRVRMPLDAEHYEAQLSERIAQSALREPSDVEAEIDMDASYR